MPLTNALRRAPSAQSSGAAPEAGLAWSNLSSASMMCSIISAIAGLMPKSVAQRSVLQINNNVPPQVTCGVVPPTVSTENFTEQPGCFLQFIDHTRRGLRRVAFKCRNAMFSLLGCSNCRSIAITFETMGTKMLLAVHVSEAVLIAPTERNV